MNTYPKMKTFSCFIIAILLTALISCSENSAEHEPINPIEGTYLLQGFQINKGLCYASSCESEILWSDTLYRSFEISVEKIDYRQDTLLFRGLEGADININHPYYSGSASDETCFPGTNPRDCAYARLVSDTLYFDLLSQPGYYYGTGILKNGELKLTTQFLHRGAGVDFFLTGYKINNKL